MKDQEVFKTYAPFGVATKRFTKIGFHPELDKSGAMKREISKLGPGSYSAKTVRCKSKQGMNWKHKLDVEDFSKYLGYRNAHILRERIWDKSMRGPGNVDINEDLFRKQTSSQMKNVGMGSGLRMHEEFMGQDAPPPDMYFKNLVEEFKPSKKTFSKLPTFEFDGKADRFKSKEKPYHLPMNLYNIRNNKNTADITEKVVSKRGPYDMFTGPRDDTTIKNHFCPPLTRGPDYFYIKPSSLQYLTTHPDKRRCGLFLKGPRFQNKPTLRHMLNDLSLCYKDPSQPGPAHYHSKQSSIKECPPTKFPFNSSNVNARPPVDWKISPGPGRYNPKAPRCMKLKKPSWVFLSKANRSLFKVENYSLF